MSLIKPSFSTGYAKNASESANPNLWKGLVGAWMPSFGVTGNTLKDVSGNGNEGTLTNMNPDTDWLATSKGLALDFDNSVHKVSYQTNFQSELQNDFTFSCLVKFNAADDRDTIFGNYNASSGWLNFERHTSNRLRHVYRNGASVVDDYSPNNSVSAGWNFVNFTRQRISSTQSRLIYHVNGKEVRNASISYVDRTVTWPNFFLGADTRNIFTNLNGNIAFASIHNRALSPTEIKQLYLNPAAPFQKKTTTVVSVPVAPVTTTAKAIVLKKPKQSYATGDARNASESANTNLWKGLVGAWMPSFGVTGETLRDVSGNGNDAVQVGAGSGWQASSLRNGSVNKYNPDINRYMIAEDAASIQPTSLTASFWVNVFALRNNESGFLDKQADPTASQNYLNTCFHGYVYAGYLLFRLASPSNANHVLIGDQSSFGGTNTPFSNFLNEWLHVACTYDEKTGQANLYRDGQKVVTRTSSASPLKTGTGDLLVNGIHPVSRFCLNGLLNSMLIHNRALSPTEIKQLYLNPAAPFLRKQQTVGLSTAQAFNPYWGNQATQLAGTLQ